MGEPVSTVPATAAPAPAGDEAPVESTATPTENEDIGHESEEEREAREAEEQAKAEAQAAKRKERNKRRNRQRRNAENIRLREELAYERGKNEALANSGNPGQEEGDTDPRPDRDDFETYDEFTEAIARWSYRQEAKAGQEDQPKPQQPPRQESGDQNEPDGDFDANGVKSFNERGYEQYGEDFQDLVDAAMNNEFATSKEMADYYMTEENGIAVAMHFFENPDEAARVAALSPAAQIREMDKIAGQQAPAPSTDDDDGDPPKPAARRISNAPEPPGKNDKAAGNLNADTPEKAAGRGDTAKYVALRRKQMANR